MFNYLVQRVFSGLCVLCDAPGYDGLDLCQQCYSDLPRNQNACFQCGGMLTDTSERVSQHCGMCLQDTPSFYRTVTPFQFGYPVDHFVRALKFNGELKYARLMGSLLAREIRSHYSTELPELLLPVPLHKYRFRERGFNQSELIAEYCAKALGVSMHSRTLRRHRCTDSQSGLGREQRRLNLHGAFSITDETLLQDKVVLVDDVMTTGSTVEALASSLTKAGVAEVHVWVFSRTLKEH